MRARAVSPTLVLATLAALGLPGVVLADDTTPPVGTLEIEEGRGYTDDGNLILDVPAVDDVGVVEVRARLVGGTWTDFPYAPRVEWTFGDPAEIAQQQLNVQVMWRDAAGNASTAEKMIWLDTAPPDLQIFKTTTSYPGPPGTVTFYVGAYEEASGVAAVRFSTDNGAHWGAEIPMTDQIVVWDPRDPTVGGKPNGIGAVKVLAKVRDGSGQWSNIRSTTVQFEASVHIKVSANPATGQLVTFTPEWSTPVALPAGTYCMWEFMTGDDESLYSGDHDESFSYNMTQGPRGGGWCGPWTFTLPWSTVRQYLVAFRVMLPDGSDIDAELGSPQHNAFTSTVGSTSRNIASSNLPMFYVLPDDHHLTVGQPATYRGFAIGGATIRSSDQWRIVGDGTNIYAGAPTFTFTPQQPGHITVCLHRRPGNTPMDQLAACFDPTVARAPGGPTMTASPSAAPTAPSEAAPTAPSASDAGLSTTPGAVAIGPAYPSVTQEPQAPPDQDAAARSAPPAVPWPVLTLGVVVLLGGVSVLVRRDVLAKLRSRARR